MRTPSPLHLRPLLLCLLLSTSVAHAADRPLTGAAIPAFARADHVILQYMDTFHCHAAALAISKDGQLLYSRGYGWSDSAHTTPAPPDALFRIASVTKFFTAIAIKNAVRAQHLSLDTRAYPFLNLQPPAQPADPRLNDIEINHLLDHRAGWDLALTFDPMFRSNEIGRDLGLERPATPPEIVRYMYTQPLQFTPGTKRVYSNFGYCLLGRVVEKAFGTSYADYLAQAIFAPLHLTDIKFGHTALAARDPREVAYPVPPEAFSLEVMDSHGALIASAPALCQVMHLYALNGDLRSPNQHTDARTFGSLDGSTALVRQRHDGLDFAVLFNGRRAQEYLQDRDALQSLLDRALDQLPTVP